MYAAEQLKVMMEACQKAGRALLRDFGELGSLHITEKGPRDFVTSADKKSEKILVNHLAQEYPDYSFITEESGTIMGEEPYAFVIDPIDGTSNFMRGLPMFAISLALVKIVEGKPMEVLAGVVHAPALNEIYSALQGRGAFTETRRKIQPSNCRELDQALMSSYVRNLNPQFEDDNLKALTHIKANMRVIGSAALELCYVASGKLDGFWCRHLKSWDMAAGLLIAREAGAIVSDLDGGIDPINSGNIIATNPFLAKPLQTTLANYF